MRIGQGAAGVSPAALDECVGGAASKDDEELGAVLVGARVGHREAPVVVLPGEPLVVEVLPVDGLGARGLAGWEPKGGWGAAAPETQECFPIPHLWVIAAWTAPPPPRGGRSGANDWERGWQHSKGRLIRPSSPSHKHPHTHALRAPPPL